MSHYKAALTAGLAMFAMFFGSGNLVFPLIIGMQTTDQYLIASLGLMITAVVVPFVGLFGMVLFQGNKDKYFGLLGKYAPFILSLLILSLIGPFGVVPRCILVSYGGISLVAPEVPLFFFSGFFLFLVIFIIWQKDKIVPVIGKILGPVKIGGLLLIIFAAVWQSPQLVATTKTEDSSFLLGLYQGYQTMDLMAAFFFSVAIVQYLSKVCKNKEETIKVSLLASFVGAFCIACVYLGLVALGAHYAADLANVNKEQYLATIARLTLGENAAWIVALTIFLSCLATAATLVLLFAEFLNLDVSKKKISWHVSIYITIGISFALSLLGFSTIMTLLGNILTCAYPALITLALSAILNYLYGFKYTRQAFWLTIAVTLLYRFI